MTMYIRLQTIHKIYQTVLEAGNKKEALFNLNSTSRVTVQLLVFQLKNSMGLFKKEILKVYTRRITAISEYSSQFAN